MFNLSVVSIIPDDHKDTINQIAEAYGCGSNNLSVKLNDGGVKYFGAVIHGGSQKTMLYFLMKNWAHKSFLPNYCYHLNICMPAWF